MYVRSFVSAISHLARREKTSSEKEKEPPYLLLPPSLPASPPFKKGVGGEGRRRGGAEDVGAAPRADLKRSFVGLVNFLRSPLGTVILAVMPDAIICCAILLPLRPPLSLEECFGRSRRYYTLFYFDWRGIRDFLFVAGRRFRSVPALALHK